jgi:methyltransferase
MAMTIAYLVLLGLVGLGRLVELRVSRRNQRRLAKHGYRKIFEPRFKWMVCLHAGVLVGTATEVLALRRPLVFPLAVAMGLLFVLANVLRWWTIRTLAERWNVEVMTSSPGGVVASGPYKWIRHPNYAAVAVELFALPMIHTAWITALVGTAANMEILRHRLRLEEQMLLIDPAYRAAMAAKPRFLPRFF